MLIEFSVENFCSIRDEVYLSLVAGPGSELSDTNVMDEFDRVLGLKKIKLLKSAALFGPNAGGKSNLVKALAAMQRIVITSSQIHEDLPVIPFKFNETTSKAPSTFEVIILSEDVRYQYGFSATSSSVHEEWLYAFPKGRPQLWFYRTLVSGTTEFEYNFGSKLSGSKDVWKNATRPNALFLSTAIQLNSQQLQPVYDWFANTLRVVGPGELSPQFSIRWCQNENKKKILDFLKTTDFAISDLSVLEENFSADSMLTGLPSQLDKFLEGESDSMKPLQLTTLHQSDSGEEVELDLKEESSGTRKMFVFAGQFLNSLEKGNVLVIDELHDNLHPLLVRFLIELFHNNKTNTKCAQLVFTTHETSILNQKIFRKVQIWFCERTKDQYTNLYPLSDFSPRKGVENLESAYLSGRYGAIPFLRTANQV